MIQCDTYDSCDIISIVDSESKLIIEEDHNDTFEFEENPNNRYINFGIFFKRTQTGLFYINILSVLLIKRKRKHFVNLNEQHRHDFQNSLV